MIVDYGPRYWLCAQSYIEDHHDDKAYGEGDGARVGVFALLRLGDKLLNNNIEHGARGEG